MNSPILVINLWRVLCFWLSATSAWQPQNGVENWGSAPRIWHASKVNFYQRPFFGSSHEVRTTASAVPLQNGIGSRRNIPQNWNTPRLNLYQRSFYGPKHEVKSTAPAVPLQNGIGSRRNIPQNWNTPRANLYQRSFYGPKHEVKTTAPAVPLPNGIGSRRNIPQNWNTPRVNLYQRSFYGPKHEVKMTARAAQLQNGIGNRRNVAQNWNTPKSNLYQRPFYGPKVKEKTTARAARLQNGIGNGGNFPPNWNTQNTNPHQKPFYGPNYRLGKTSSPSWFHNHGHGNGRNVPRNWNLPNTNPYQKPFYGPKLEAQATARTVQFQNTVGSENNTPPNWNAPNTNRYQKSFYGRSHRKTTTQSRLQNDIGKRPNAPRNWIPAKTNLYQMPLYDANDEMEKLASLKGQTIMRSNVENTPLGRRIAPQIVNWLSTAQRNRIPQTGEVIRSPLRSFVATPEIDSWTTGLTDPRVTSNYKLQEYSIGRNLEPLPSQSPSDVYNTGDVTLKTVFSKVSSSESNLIPESVSNQRAKSRTAYIGSATEEQQRPVPRKSYVTTGYTRKEIRLNDPKLIKLRQILPNLKRRSLDQMKVEDGNHFPYSESGTGARWHVPNGARSFHKRHSIEKKSSIRKVKGRQNWSILNEFTPNVRLANMILLKQKRQNIRKRELNQLATKGKKRTLETAAHNTEIQNASVSKKQNKSEASPPSWAKHNVYLKRVKSRGIRKRHKKSRARNFINGRNNGYFVSPARAYLNRQFAPFDGMIYGRQYVPYFSTREQFQPAQMAMAERMRAMRSRGLFHSLGNINPQFFSRNPFRYPAMPMPGQFEAMKLHGMTTRNFPFQYGRTSFPQTQDYFSAPWNMRLANRMGGTEEEENDSGGIMSQDSYNQESIKPNMDESKSPESSSQVDSGKFAGSYQSPVTEQSSQILKIDDNKLFEGHPVVNSESNVASNQGFYGKTSPRLTGMQVTDQSSTMLNKWYPIRTGRVSLMPDPRKYSAQWPSGLPGLDVATKFNQLQARGYSALNNPATFNRFNQGNEQSLQQNVYEQENENNIPSNWNNINSYNAAFNRGYQMPFPIRLFMMQRSGMNGIASEGYFPNFFPSYPPFPFTNFPNYGRKKREVRQEKNSFRVKHGKDSMLQRPFSDGNNQTRKSSTLSSESHKINNETEEGKTHSKETKIHNKSALFNKHYSSTRKKGNVRSTRDFVNAGNYFTYAGTPLSTPFYAVANHPRMRLMYPQLSVEDPMNEIKRKGYSVASGPFGVGLPSLSSQSPLQYTAAGPLQPIQRIQDQELAYPVGPPQSLMELSQKVDQFPAQEFLSSGKDVSPETQKQDSDVNDDDLSASKLKENQPKTVSAAMNLFSSQEPLDSSEQPSIRKPRGVPNVQNEPEQTVSEIATSPPSYSFGMGGVSQSIQGPPNGYVPEFPEQSSSEFSDEGTQGMSENEPQENGQGFSEEGEASLQGDNVPDDGAEDEPAESDSELTPGLFDGLDSAQTSLLKQQMRHNPPMRGFRVANFNTFTPYQKGRKRLPPANRLSPSDRQMALIRQNAMTRQKALLKQQATFSTKENIQGSMQGNILGGTPSGRNSHILSLPNLSLNTIEKLIDSAPGEQSKSDYNTGAVHGYGSNSKSSVGNKVTNEDLNVQDSSEHTSSASDWNIHNRPIDTGKFVHNFDWKSPLMSQSQSPSDFNWKLERALTQWKEPVNPNHDPANSGGTLPDSQSDNVFVPPKGSNGNPDVVPGYTFDTQGQRSGPLFLPNPPPDLVDDTSAETVLMVPGSGNKLKSEAGAKKETISKKRSQRKNKTV